MPPTALNAFVRSTQELAGLLVLHLLNHEPGLTELQLRERIHHFNLSGELFWRPGKGTMSRVVKGFLKARYIKGRWPDDRRRPLELTEAGRRRLAVMRENLRQPLGTARSFLDRVYEEVYERR